MGTINATKYPTERSKLVNKWQRIVDALAGTSFEGVEWNLKAVVLALIARGIVTSPIIVVKGIILEKTPIMIEK